MNNIKEIKRIAEKYNISVKKVFNSTPNKRRADYMNSIEIEGSVKNEKN